MANSAIIQHFVVHSPNFSTGVRDQMQMQIGFRSESTSNVSTLGPSKPPLSPQHQQSIFFRHTLQPTSALASSPPLPCPRQ
jgi:hypothetical protein